MLENGDEISVNSLLYKSILELCHDKENGIYYFCKFIIGDLINIGYPKPFRYNKLLRTWDRLVKKYKKLAILCFRGAGKSVWFSELLNIYDMFLFKHRRIILVSSSNEQAEHFLGEMKDIIDNNEWLASKKDMTKWATASIKYNFGYVIAKGIGSEILGQHVDRIVLDDVLRTDNKLSDKEVEDYIDMNLSPMLLNRDGQMILVGTVKSSTDVYSTIRNRIKEEKRCPWHLEMFPAILSYENKVLQCPDRFSWDVIMSKRLEMGSLKFAREYQLEFFTRDKSLFPARIMAPAKDKGKEMRLIYKADKRPPNWIYIAGVDVARSGSVSADYSVMIVLAYDTVSHTKQIVHMWREKGLKITEQARQISEITRNFDNCMAVVETNNMGQDLIDSLVDDYNVFVEPFTVSGAAKKEEIIRFLIRAFETEQMIIPRGDDYSKETMDLLEDELSKYCVTSTPAGNEKFEGVGATDDCVSSLALANKGTQIGGVPFAVTVTNSDITRRDPYGAFVQSYNTKETDLVKKIRMGLIK